METQMLSESILEGEKVESVVNTCILKNAI